MPIMVVSSVKAVNTKKTTSKLQIRERTIVYEGSSGPRELLEAIVIQAQAASKGLEGARIIETSPEEMTEEQKRMRVPDENDNGKGKGKAKSVTPEVGEESVPYPEENLRLLDFCRRILSTAAAIDRSLRETKGDAFLERLRASLPKVPSSVADSAAGAAPAVIVDVGKTDQETLANYVDWATRVRFEYCDLRIAPPPMSDGKVPEDWSPNYKFFYNNEARMLTNSDIPKRSLAIAKEVQRAGFIVMVAELTGLTVGGFDNESADCLGLVDFPARG